MNRPFRVALIGLLLILAVPLHAATYKWMDTDGRVVYSQTPPADAEYEVISSGHPRLESDDPDEVDATAPLGAESPSGDTEEEISKIAAESQAIREKNCQGAKQNLQTYQTYRRVRDDDGNVSLLTDDERQAKIEEAKQMITDFCD